MAYEGDRLYDISLWTATILSTWPRLLFGICLKIISDVGLVTSPLLIKVILEQILLGNAFHAAVLSGELTDDLARPKSVGYGIGLAAALLVLLFGCALVQTHYIQILYSMGAVCRSAVIDLISRKSM
jgi:ATP-binding cassette subfamily C (CFTR/MRP) protein 1